MPKKSRRQLQREIDDAIALKELEETAADYVGVAQARQMAADGYFKRQLARSRSSTPAAPRPDERRFEIQNLGGAVLGRETSRDRAMLLADKTTAPDLALVIVERRTDGRRPRRVAERILWNTGARRRQWELLSSW